ncbi:hypothetical protein B9T54_08335 [Leptospira borgpetersenii serovar Hardjo-bovis]|nr:hypothetical protein B9T54_08335 [Leptospira borgpetersenii serovar Hardjo-bovis]
MIFRNLIKQILEFSNVVKRWFLIRTLYNVLSFFDFIKVPFGGGTMRLGKCNEIYSYRRNFRIGRSTSDRTCARSR